MMRQLGQFVSPPLLPDISAVLKLHGLIGGRGTGRTIITTLPSALVATLRIIVPPELARAAGTFIAPVTMRSLSANANWHDVPSTAAMERREMLRYTTAPFPANARDNFHRERVQLGIQARRSVCARSHSSQLAAVVVASTRD